MRLRKRLGEMPKVKGGSEAALNRRSRQVLTDAWTETEAMKDGSDAIADWPILNALLNTASGASWVSFHHGGGVGIGYSLHAGQVSVADGTVEGSKRLHRVLTNDPGIGVARHVDAGYELAEETARKNEIRIPMLRSES